MDERTQTLPTTERRSEERWTHYVGCRVALEGLLGRLDDLCSTGARVECARSFPRDAVVRLDLPWGVPVRATVLASDHGRSRLRFDYPVEP